MDHLVVAPRDGVLVLRRRKVNMTVVCCSLYIYIFFVNLFVDIDIYIYLYVRSCRSIYIYIYLTVVENISLIFSDYIIIKSLCRDSTYLETSWT